MKELSKGFGENISEKLFGGEGINQKEIGKALSEKAFEEGGGYNILDVVKDIEGTPDSTYGGASIIDPLISQSQDDSSALPLSVLPFQDSISQDITRQYEVLKKAYPNATEQQLMTILLGDSTWN